MTVPENLISIETDLPIWHHVYVVSPLVVIGTKEGDRYDLATKHQAMPLGHDNYYGFMCTPKHGTYHNVKREEGFTVSYLRPSQVLTAGLASSPRCDDPSNPKPILDELPTFIGGQIDAPCLQGGYLFLECKLHQIVDNFGDASLITGKIAAAYVDEDSLRVYEGDDQRLIFNAPMLAYLAYDRFAQVRDTLTFLELPEEPKNITASDAEITKATYQALGGRGLSTRWHTVSVSER